MSQLKFHDKIFTFCFTTIIFATLLKINPTIAASSTKKNFGERRVSVDSDLRVQYHERTAALTEWDDENTLIGCELVSISDNSTFNKLTGLIIDEPKPITFDEMNELISHCDNIDLPLKKKKNTIFSKQTLNIVSGIFPGTKWCGSSNLAKSYHDLGLRSELDRCCRAHDFCPVKIRGKETRFNITNTSQFTKLHCKCDDIFYNCLKSVEGPAANLVGRTYFNFSKRDCFEQNTNSTNNNYEFREPKKEF
ncbi:uncharacterized protein LOC129611060 [Condylostylus longicornis]|uniref:uncharacterized protein LOC129611060 n=1 Tax=Condylostylus longicornis TaxID=2530218 RepID=UPI00244DA429|nr:uncharacterized protein LOC129611060 [Condylostylus longicornis]